MAAAEAEEALPPPDTDAPLGDGGAEADAAEAPAEPPAEDAGVRAPPAKRTRKAEGDGDALAQAAVPTSFRKKLRACMRCNLVKTSEQFFGSGCENCPFLNMEQDNERVHSCTTAAFSGIICLTKPHETWAGKWVRVAKQKPGVYAISVTGQLPEEIAQIVNEAGVWYEPREV